MVTLEALKNIRFVVDISGKQAAVQVSIDDWRKILDYFEELEDRERVKEVFASVWKFHLRDHRLWIGRKFAVNGKEGETARISGMDRA